ncbi:MAG: exosortase-associated EpsI family protein, partial [Planctomycetota bacterium]
MPILTRVAVAALILIAGHFATVAAKARFEFDVTQPTFDLAEFPEEVGDYVGKDTEMDDGVRGVLKAKTSINRVYRGRFRPEVRIHGAVWSDMSHVSDGCPHHPDVCYPAQGWSTESVKTLTVETAAGRSIPVRLALMSREFERVVVAHTYRLGADSFTNIAEARPVLEGLRGTGEWPHVMKLMIQNGTADLDAARPSAEFFVKEVFDWLD